MKKKALKPNTYFGFPVEECSELEGASKLKSKGIAMLIAILVITMVVGFMSDLIITSTVNVELASGNKDRIKAEYMAKSGFNMALFLNSIDWGLDLFMNQQKQKPSDGIGDIWAALNGIPIGGATLAMMDTMSEKFNLGKLEDRGALSQLSLFDGEFIIDASDESSKINVNYCSKGRCSQVLLMLQSLFSCPVEKEFLEKRNLTPSKMAYRIKDYIDTNDKAEGETGFSEEDEPYRKSDPPYRAKNSPLESVEELKMIAGWDDDMHAVFSRYLTVYPYQNTGRDVAKININTASREMLACLLPEGLTESCSENFAITMANQGKEKQTFTEDGDLKTVLRNLMCYDSAAGEKTGSAKDKSSWFSTSSRVFRLNVVGTSGMQTKKLSAVIERLDSKDMKKRKVDRSFELLYYKLM